MRLNPLQRLQKRAVKRLEEIDMTARQLAVELGHGDAWISAVLNGRQGIQLKDLDAFAAAIRLPVSELVREEDAELVELTPTELRFLKRFRDWPAPVQAHWMALVDHFATTQPDRDVAVIASLLAEKPPAERGLLVRWLERLTRVGLQPEDAGRGSEWPKDVPTGDTTPEHPQHRGFRKPSRHRK